MIKNIPTPHNYKSQETEIIDSNIIDDTNKGLTYIQMRLPIQKITKKFETSVLNKLKRNIIRAQIRKAKEDDLKIVMNIYNRAWMTSNTPYAPISVLKLKKIYDYPKTEILIARVYGIDAGFIILDFEGVNHEYGITLAMGILPRFQRKGIGTILGIASWDYFRKTRIEEIRAEVYIDNKRSYNFLNSLGFEEFGKKYYKK